jgi:alkylation response protein AidB-like acyl-CoA dehydrogenase
LDFSYSPEEREFAAVYRRFLGGRATRANARDLPAHRPGYNTDDWAAAVEIGVVGLTVPDDLGGSDATLAEALPLLEETGAALQPGPYAVSTAAALLLKRFGGNDVARTALKAIASGAGFATCALIDDSGRWSSGSTTTQARPTADGWVLSGAKRFVPYGDAATFVLVSACVSGGSPGLFIVEPQRRPDALRMRVQRTLDLGHRYVAMDFDDLALPHAAYLGEGRAVALLVDDLTLLNCVESLGAAERLLSMTVAYAGQREQFGRPIGSFQAIKHKCADMRMWVDTARAAIYGACLAAGDDPGSRYHASVAKAVTGRYLTELAATALQVHGGIGMTWEYDLHLYLRRIRSHALLYGTTTFHQNAVAEARLSRVASSV